MNMTKEEGGKKIKETKTQVEHVKAKAMTEKQEKVGAELEGIVDKLANEEVESAMWESDGTDKIIESLFQQWTYVDAPLAST